MTDYRSLINRIEDRYNPELITEARNRTIASLAGIDRDVAKYVKLAMNEVDPLYTQKTLDAGSSGFPISRLSYDTYTYQRGK